MNGEESVRSWWEDEYERRAEEERLWKYANHCLIELRKAYARLSSTEQESVNRSLEEWIGDDDAGRQFVAEGLVREFHLRSFLPVLGRARDRSTSTDTATVFRRMELDRLIEELGQPTHS
jgi:hypothetical protein